MNNSTKQDILELEVKDFGPIVKARIDLRPLTVFIGPSNTGKSYLAILIYALHRHFSGGGWSFRGRTPWESRMFVDRGTGKLPRKAIDLLSELAGQVAGDKGELSSREGIVLPSSIIDLICSELGGWDYLGNEIDRCFGIDAVDALIRKGTKGDARIVFRRRFENDFAPIGHRLTISTHASEFKTTIADGAPMRIGVGDGDYRIEHLRRLAVEMISPSDREEERPDFFGWRFLAVLADFVRPRIFGPLDLPAFYLPADRTGVMHAHSVVVSALIESAAMTGLRPAARTPMLSGVLADFLQQLIEVDHPQHRRREPRHDLGTRIEEALLGGSVGVDRSEAIGYPRFTYRPTGWKDSLPLMNASSMVSELAPVVLYLRHMVRPRNVLILEEPESHLHPAMQVEFTRQLATLVKSGIRVIVTTHSEWVLDELANIVRRSQLPKAGQRGAVDDKVALRPDEVGAWLFKQKKRPKGSVVDEVKLDDEIGLYPTGFDEIAVELHNDWADISSRIRASQ